MSDKDFTLTLFDAIEEESSEGSTTLVPSGQRFQCQTPLKVTTQTQHPEVTKVQDDQKKEGDVLAAMKSVAAESVLFMVKDPTKVKAALETLYERTGSCNYNSEELMAVVLEEEERDTENNVAQTSSI